MADDDDPAATTAFPRLGAFGLDGGATAFRVWAPAAGSVAVEIGDSLVPLVPTGDGVFEGRVAAAAGDDYRFVLDGADRWPDPWSRHQPDGLRGPSRIVARPEYARPAAWAGLSLEDLVVYELHVGTFTPAGTFDGVIARLADLRDLGVTAIEVMPIATFAGDHGWGYDGVYTFAPHPAYGGPDGFARLVDAAHAAGVGVILDVVYNHLGAGSDAIDAFGPYQTDRHETVWGRAIDFAQPAVREWAIQNAEMWVRDYGVDGLRLDAVHSIFDESDPHVMAELAARVKAIAPGALLIDEMEIGDLRPIEGWGHDAQWEDSLHHAVHVLLTGEREGYYSGYGRIADLARELERPQGRRFVVCAQNHDQVGNRALGDRLRGRDLRLAAFCAILSPGVPMLFQGEEYDEPHPFQYFTDHIDAKIAQLTRDGRRREFSEFSGFTAEEIPDPQDPQTFARSKLDPSGGDPEHLAYYRELLALRRRLPAGPAEILEVDEDRRLLRVRRGEVELVANFADTEQDGVPARSGAVRPLIDADDDDAPPEHVPPAPDIARVRLDRAGAERFQPLRRQLGVSTFGLNLIVLEPGQRGRIHAHERQEEVYLVLDGELTLLVEGVEHRLGADEAIRVGPAVRRQLANAGPRPVVILALGGHGEHAGRDGLAWSAWEEEGPGRPPSEVPLPDDLPAGA